MTEPLVIVNHLTKHVLGITLNRPHQLNALNTKLLRQLKNCLEQTQNDKNIRAVIFTGAGEKAFCAGADLKERLNMTLDETRQFVSLIGETFNVIANLPMPTIAAINGIAFGGGLELALACDLRIIKEDVLVGLTECALGIIPGAGGTQRLPKIVGEAKAKELILTAKRIAAKEAKEIGLANQITVKDQDILESAKEIAVQIAKNAPLSVQTAKKAINDGAGSNKEKSLKFEAKCYESILHTQDRLEGLRAFLEKREPKYIGK